MSKESKEDRFKRVAEKRVNNVLHNLSILSNCSNRRLYQWNNHQLKKIWSAIDAEMKRTKEKFIKRDSKTFSL